MALSRSNQSRRQRSRDNFDRRLDQWVETGRQFVDGVAGNRPGKRRLKSFDRREAPNFESVGRWVNDKIDWFLEEEEDWEEPWEKESTMHSLRTKRPLDAISRRVHQKVLKSKSDQDNFSQPEEWPDESSFRVDRWRRPHSERQDGTDVLLNSETNSVQIDKRPLPRSSRRRI